MEDHDSALADLIWLAAHTGARIEELCSLKRENVNGEVLTIPGTKTDAAARKVPIHSAIRASLDRLVQDSKDGYLIASTTKNQYDERSAAIGERFGRLKTRLGYGPGLVFHSIRKTVATEVKEQKP